MKNLAQQIEHFISTKECISQDGDNSCHNFYDWFCSDSSLEAKGKSLMNKVIKFIKANPSIDTSKHYVFFKNNCPFNGPLYDDFRICDIETGDVIFNVTPKSGHSGKAEVWGKSNDFKEILKEGKNFTELLA